MNSMGADSIWLWSFIWTWQEAAAAAHQREALWGEDQIRACDARTDRAKRTLWMHTHTHTHGSAHEPTHCCKGIQSNSTLSVHFHYMSARTALHRDVHTHLLRFTFMLTILNMGGGVINRCEDCYRCLSNKNQATVQPVTGYLNLQCWLWLHSKVEIHYNLYLFCLIRTNCCFQSTC